MKNKVLPLILMLLSVSASADTTIVKPVEMGFDNAVMSAFHEAALKSAVDSTDSLGIEQVKNVVSNVKIQGEDLVITFSDEKLVSLLNNSGIATWSGLEAPVLVWFVSVSDNDISVLSGDGSSEFATALNAASNANSYNLLFPLMDLDDSQLVNAQTVLSHSDTILAKASKRYDAQFFVAGAYETNPEDGTLVVKWNVYDSEGRALGEGECTGETNECASVVSKEVARVLMQNVTVVATKEQQELKTATGEEDKIPDETDDGTLVLGPVNGGVQVQFVGIDSVADYPKIRHILITYGYESDVKIMSYSKDGVVFLIPTGSAPEILDGTLAHAGEFSKIGPWIYKFNQSAGKAPGPEGTGTVGKADTRRVTTEIIYPDAPVENVSPESGDVTPVKNVKSAPVSMSNDLGDDEEIGIRVTE
ncbi:MAG: DUF2066 domain-containing protein [Succinivibrio sp.]